MQASAQGESRLAHLQQQPLGLTPLPDRPRQLWHIKVRSEFNLSTSQTDGAIKRQGLIDSLARSQVGISAMGVLRPDLMMKCIVPVVMAGIIAIYGLVVSVLISSDLQSPMPLYSGFIQLGAGLSVGLAGLSAGFAIGIVGDAGVRGTAQQ